jgi:hypothetical protein
MKARAFHFLAALCVGLAGWSLVAQEAAPELRLNEKEYFAMPGLNVMAFQDIYPEGHQAGVSIIQNGVRVATNGDLRLDRMSGQWQPMPKQDKRLVDAANNEITTWLSYPDPARNRTGYNPIDYPDLNLSYQVHVRGEGQAVRVIVDLDQPLPAAFVGKVGFNLELYPGSLFGKTWYLGGQEFFRGSPMDPMKKQARAISSPCRWRWDRNFPSRRKWKRSACFWKAALAICNFWTDGTSTTTDGLSCARWCRRARPRARSIG